MYDLEQAINERRSIRMFLPDKPVPREMVDLALELAIRAPSNSNVQPWHLRLVSGAARDRLVAALLDEASSKPPVVPELPELFAHLRRELGARFTAPWASPVTTPTAAASRCSATGSSSAHRWPASSACTATCTMSTPSASACSYRRSCSR